MFFKVIGLQFCFVLVVVVVSLSDLGMSLILASQNELGSVPSLSTS
jgi:hypothetical protein